MGSVSIEIFAAAVGPELTFIMMITFRKTLLVFIHQKLKRLFEKEKQIITEKVIKIGN